jgi:hypothetical protein
MQDCVRQAILDLIFLSQQVNSSERERILETIDRFRLFMEEEDYNISLYEKLLPENHAPPVES